MHPHPRNTRSKALVGIGIVAVVGAGLGAYFGIRGVEGAGSAPSGGQPPARTGAAMAYDAADGTVVMFGGEGRSGSLGDTWTWNGSAWTQAHPATSPPALTGAQMTYDPVSHDVLLVGGQRVTGAPLGGAVCEATGSSGSGSAGSGSSSSTKWIPPTSAQPADASAPGGNLTIPLIATGCGISDAANAATWLWNGSDWTKAATTTPSVGFGEWNLATDPVSGKALLLADRTLVEPDTPIAEPAIACPMQTTVTNGADAPACPVFPIQTQNQSWMWTGHAWQAIKKVPNTAATDVLGSRVITDAVTGQLAIFGNEFVPIIGTTCPTCTTGAPVPNEAPACCTGSVSVWSGTAWKQANTYKNGPLLSNGVFAGDPATHSDVALTPSGQTWVWTGTWTREHPGTTPTALDGTAFAYDATSHQVVVFGGIGLTGRASGLYNQTWTWNGTDWSLRGGSSGPAYSIPVPSPVSVPPALRCKSPQPLPPANVPQPQYACAGSTPGSTGGGSGSVSGSPGAETSNASGSVSSSGVVAP